MPPDFPKAKRLYLAFGDNLPRLREWFGAFYHKPELADQVAVWGSTEHLICEIRRLKDAGKHVLLNPVFDEEQQMQRLAMTGIPRI